MRLITIVIILVISFSLPVRAQEDTTALESSEKGKKEKNFSWIVVPALSVNPTNGFMYGIAGTVSWFMGDRSRTTLSDANANISYTTKKQLLITFRSNVFLKDDQWILKGDWRYLATSQPTFGLGTGPQSAKPVANGSIEYEDGMFAKPIPDEQMILYDHLRLHETVYMRIRQTRFFAGAGYHLDFFDRIRDNLLDLKADTPVITSHYAYSYLYGYDTSRYVISGVSANLCYDSRDNPVFPTSGRYAFISFRYNPTFLGSAKNSTSLWMEYRDYINLSVLIPRHLIGIWVYGNFITTGSVPYMGLPALGWDQFNRSGRGYTQGRFRGPEFIYSEAEYRFPIPIFKKNPDLLGAVFFVNATTASNHDAPIELFEYVDYAYGLGLRIQFSKVTRANITIDYAIGKYGASGFYLNINETF